MKFMLGCSIVLLAAADAAGDVLLDPVTNVGVNCVLGVVVLVLVVRVIPTITKHHAEALDALRKQLHENSVTLNATLRDMTAHCSKRGE